jgi:ABC-type branched-subunit amino acid transport system substrate-binding protein
VNPVILAVEEINAAGGLLGHKVGYIIEDHKANAGTALSVARKLTEIDNVALISTSISPAVLAALPVPEEHHVFIMTPAQHPKILQIQAFTKEFEALGEKVVSTEMFNNGDQDMRGQLNKLKGAAPDLLNISATGPRAYGLVLKEAAELGYRPKAVIATDTLIDPQLREIAGDLASGIYYAAMDFDPKWNSTKFKPRFGYDGDAQAAMVYDGINIWFEAVKRTGSLDPVKVRDTLVKISDFPGVTGTWGYKGNGEPTLMPVIKRTP